MFCGSYHCLKVSHLPGWCYLAVSVLLLPRHIVKVQLGLGKICSEQDDMKKDRTMVHDSQLAFLLPNLEQKKHHVPCSSHPRPQAEEQFLSLSLSDGQVLFVTPLFLYFRSFTSLPLDIIKNKSLCCLTVTAPVNICTATLVCCFLYAFIDIARLRALLSCDTDYDVHSETETCELCFHVIFCLIYTTHLKRND